MGFNSRFVYIANGNSLYFKGLTVTVVISSGVCFNSICMFVYVYFSFPVWGIYISSLFIYVGCELSIAKCCPLVCLVSVRFLSL